MGNNQEMGINQNKIPPIPSRDSIGYKNLQEKVRQLRKLGQEIRQEIRQEIENYNDQNDTDTDNEFVMVEKEQI